MFSFWRTYTFLFRNNRFQEIFPIIRLKVLPQASQGINSCLFLKSSLAGSSCLESLIFNNVLSKARFVTAGVSTTPRLIQAMTAVSSGDCKASSWVYHVLVRHAIPASACMAQPVSPRCPRSSQLVLFFGRWVWTASVAACEHADSRVWKLGNSENRPTRPLDQTIEMLLSCLFLLLMTWETSRRF